jgi:hypothetical protein
MSLPQLNVTPFLSPPLVSPHLLSDAYPRLSPSNTLSLVSLCIFLAHTHIHSYTHSQTLSIAVSHTLSLSLYFSVSLCLSRTSVTTSSIWRTRSLAYCNHGYCPMSNMGPLNVCGIPRPLRLHCYVHTVCLKLLWTSAFIQLNGRRGLCNIIVSLLCIAYGRGLCILM